MIEIPNLVEGITQVKMKSIKRSPCYVTRSSSLGYAVPSLDGCIRRGVYERTNWGDKKLFSVDTIMIFDEGDRQERAVLEDLAKANFPIIEQQSAFVIKNKAGDIIISGHLDGKIICTDNETGVVSAVPIEIKSMHPNIFQGVNSLADFKKKSWTKAYLAQMTVYLLGNNMSLGLFILKNKSSGQLKQIVMDLDYELGEDCLKTAELIEEYVKNKELPDRIENRDTCKDCPFGHICLPDLDFGQEIEVADDPSFEEKLDRYFELKENAAESDKLYDDIIHPRCKATAKDGFLNMLLGKYQLEGKTDKKGAFRLKIKLITDKE